MFQLSQIDTIDRIEVFVLTKLLRDDQNITQPCLSVGLRCSMSLSKVERNLGTVSGSTKGANASADGPAHGS